MCSMQRFLALAVSRQPSAVGRQSNYPVILALPSFVPFFLLLLFLISCYTARVNKQQW
jgi:hypothetical protein